MICPAADWPYRTLGILNSWPKKESCHTSHLFSRHAGIQRVFEDAHPGFGKLSDFLSFRITNKVMVEGHKGPQVNDLLAGGLEQQVGAGIGLVGAVEAGDLVVCGLEGKSRVDVKRERSRLLGATAQKLELEGVNKRLSPSRVVW